MAALMIPRMLLHSCKLRNLQGVIPAIKRLPGVLDQGTFVTSQSARTLLSDAFHAEDTWINRERIVVDMDEMKINLDRSFHDLKEPVMSVELHKYIDNVYDKEELDVAEGYLYDYRHSPMAHHLKRSTVHSFLRLCIELGYAQKALNVLQNKRDYGLFPEPFTYNLLLDSFLRADDFKGACDVAIVMMREETLEDCPLSQLLALYACHHYLKLGEIPQEEEWDVGMTLADATRNVEGTLALSYHAVGYALTGRLDKVVAVLESIAEMDEAQIAQEAVDRLESVLNKQEDLSAELKEHFKEALKKVQEGNRVLADSLDSLLDSEISSRLAGMEVASMQAVSERGYVGLLEAWHQEHMDALERQRLAILDAERREKEERLDRLLRETGGLKYWAEEIKTAKRKGVEEGAVEQR